MTIHGNYPSYIDISSVKRVENKPNYEINDILEKNKDNYERTKNDGTVNKINSQDSKRRDIGIENFNIDL